ncbi:uncharacterized protein MYCFIDRAFT_204792 [Pseudocercospora fijiensis CIRAD86]|uniref:Metallo-beta-lactamase domain-containing protein n=1 Tax=Pseudocercospora fijiensis (strain CIRAD86) TaxID=383855 RepID=M2ZJS9_PSEFD|nr:uncharacterized protein MYCFIDRAFT_204792 [Pseudocercospora fijiensis CIRAD86]EME79359.1 hypothetical protein MYCFIDRAFT_204792 [Pseudocercospora fijiensis CIRAD86]
MASPTPAPALNVPPGETAVTVSAIDSTLWMSGVDTEYMYSPPIKGFGRVRTGCWSFLIEHPPSGRKLLYDLGSRKDAINTTSPGWGLKKLREDGIIESFDVQKHVAEILAENGVDPKEFEGVIWSHWHFDHTGDMSTFPVSTKLIVGEGFKENFMPGYPIDPNAWTLESDFEGREVVEVPFSESGGLNIGKFRAFDYFGDGSFYILDTPGHAIGHVNALARTSVSPPEFLHLCGDSAHHCGEIRPSEYIPMPDLIDPSPLPEAHPYSCPGGMFSSLLRNGSSSEHILEFIDPFEGREGVGEQDRKFSIMYDREELMRSVRKVEGFDANENVFTILAHDWSLKGVIDEWPKGNLNDWKKRGWRKDGFWKFLEDFAGAVVVEDGAAEGGKL